MEEEVGEGLGLEPIRERGRGGHGGDGGAGGPFELNGEVGEGAGRLVRRLMISVGPRGGLI